MIFSIRTSYQSARDHPFVFSLMLFMLILYTYFPSLFAFLVSCSPVIVCTTFLLGLLLSYGEPSIPEIVAEDKKIPVFSSLKVGSAANDIIVKEDENFRVENHIEDRAEIEESSLREALLGRGNSSICFKEEEEIYSATTQNEEDEKADKVMSAMAAYKQMNKESDDVEKVSAEIEIQPQEMPENREIHADKLSEKVQEMNEDVNSSFIADKKETEDLFMETDQPGTGMKRYDSTLGFPWVRIDSDDAFSDSDSDRAESSSPDASMADILPMLDELHPLIDLEHPNDAPMSRDDSDAAFQRNFPSNEPDDDSIEEEAENHDDEEDEEAQGEKDDGTEAAVKWTEDDQKNVMDLGSSEIERNRRLESLIARRRARKNVTFVMGRNLIDLDAIDLYPGKEELSRFHVQVPTISAPRRNPFDIPFDQEESMIPGSAPSLLSRRNPFDLFYDQEIETGNSVGETWEHQEFMSVPPRDMLYRRNESFSLGRREYKQERRPSRLKPYFVAERTESEGSSSAFQRQFSDKSQMSSVPDSDTVLSVTDQDYHKELIEQEFQHDNELSSFAKDDAEPLDNLSQSSEEIKSVDFEEVKSEQVTGDHDIHLGADHLVVQETYENAEAFGAVEEENRDEKDITAIISDAEKLDEYEDKYDEPKFSSLPETGEKSFTSAFHEQSATYEQERNLESVIADIGQSTRVDKVDDCLVAEPVYDSSPLAKSKISSLDETIIDAGCDVDAGLSLKSAMQVGISGASLLPRPPEQNASSRTSDFVAVDKSTEDIASAREELSMNSLILPFIEENKSKSRGITVTRQQDVAEVGSSAVQENKGHSVFFKVPEPAVVDSMHHSNLSSMVIESSDDGPLNTVVSHFKDGPDTSTSYSDTLFLSNDFISSELEKALSSIENHDMHPVVENGVEESRMSILDLPSNPKENLRSFETEGDNLGSRNLGKIADLTGSQVFEHHKIIGTGTEHQMNLIFNEPASVILPSVPIHDGGFVGSQLIKPAESTDSSGLSEMKSELLVQLSDDLSHLRIGFGAVQRKQFSGSWETGDSSDKKSEEIHPEVVEIKEIDESLLSELDTVGDFHNKELRSNQRGHELELQVEGHSEVIGAGDLEQTVYNPKHRVLQVTSTEEADSVSEQVSEEAMPYFVSESNIDKLIASGSVQYSQRYLEQAPIDSQLLVLEARSVKDIHSAFKQISEELEEKKPIIPEAGHSQNSLSRDVLEAMEIQSDLSVVNTVSVEDIHAVLKQHSDDSSKKVPEATEAIDGSLDVKIGERQFEPEVHEVQPSGEMSLFSAETIVKDTNIAKEVCNEYSDSQIMVGVSASSSLTPRKMRKKKKTGTSSSSTSSSDSSSSDSD